MYAKMSVIVIYIEAIMCFLLHNLHLPLPLKKSKNLEVITTNANYFRL